MKPAPGSGPSYHSFRSGDIRETVLYGLSALSVRCLPKRAWPEISDGLVRLTATKSISRYEKFRSAARAVLGTELNEAGLTDLYRHNRVHMGRRRFYIAALHRGAGWKPSIELTGLDRVERARDRGVILWFDDFCHFSVVGKIAFAGAEYPFWQLSSHYHGFSGTKYGMRFLNPLQVTAELRYVRGRIAFDHRSLVAATRRVVGILHEGGIVGITNNANLGRSIELPFGEAARLRLASTPLKLAAHHNITLLPVSVIELEPLTRYRVAVGAAITPPSSESAADPIAVMASQYISYLQPLMRAHPEQWTGWRAIGNAIAAGRW